MNNQLYYGDNLEILKRHIADESVDLVYLDPPFNSNQDYNVLFAEHDGNRSAAQIKAFGDTWRWDQGAARAYEEVVENGGRVAEGMQAFRTFLGDSDMMAYLAMMAPRLAEIRRVMKPSASIYLHCDPTACHYLKMLMDSIFGTANFRNEIIWKRTSAHNDPGKYGRNIDCLLFYTKTEKWTWNMLFRAHESGYLARFRNTDPDGRRWQDHDLTGAGQGPPRSFGERGVIAPPQGRHWMFDQHGIDRIIAQGKIHWTKIGSPRLKNYEDETMGTPLQALWDDIPPVNSQAQERLGYPTQKPESLVERIIQASSNEGDVVLDPFCGCGTAIAAAEKVKRRWIGIDITHLAIGLIKHRLHDAFGQVEKRDYEVIGEPTVLSEAKILARDDPFQFQCWALGLARARQADPKRGADRGIDGKLYFHDDPRGKSKQIIFSVKAGQNLNVSHVRDLRGVIEREKAEIGVLICMEEPTRAMKAEAADAGFCKSNYGRHPRLQILTIEQLLEGAHIDYPPHAARIDLTFKRSPMIKAGKIATQKRLSLERFQENKNR